ncbi:MAG TPA: DUF3891 family protein [Chloroflexota bacterium]|jgi:hypothetical protein
MIVRPLGEGQTALIGQTDHSRLVGQLAAHWGNAQFAAPEPYDSVVRAATFHDFGWLDYETRPLANPETGKPYEFRELPFSPDQLAAYGRWVDWITAIDPYAGLLVGQHRTGLWQNRYGAIEHPGMGARAVAPAIQTFIREQEADQARLQPDYDAAQLRANYHMLQVWDLLGLYFCCRAPYDDYIEPVPTSYAGNGHVRLDLTPRGDWEVAMSPYPFDVRPLKVQIGYKAMNQDSYPSLDDFRRDYFQAESKLLTYTLV